MFTSDEGNWYVLPLNPEPWAVGPLSVRRAAGGKFFPVMGRNQQLFNYQEAVRSELKRQRAAMVELGEGYYAYELVFVFHQVLDKYTTASGRTSEQKAADLTNLVKATEDALQGIVIGNDKQVEKTTAYVQRSESGKDATPYVIIGAGPYLGINPNEFPAEVWEGVDMAVAEHRHMTHGNRSVEDFPVLNAVMDPDDEIPF